MTKQHVLWAAIGLVVGYMAANYIYNWTGISPISAGSSSTASS